jgi:hypothetical protein
MNFFKPSVLFKDRHAGRHNQCDRVIATQIIRRTLMMARCHLGRSQTAFLPCKPVYCMPSSSDDSNREGYLYNKQQVGQGRSTVDPLTTTFVPSLRLDVMNAYQRSHEVFAPLDRVLAG